MEYRRLGRTGLLVSEIGFGCEWLEHATRETVQEVVDRATELGINIMDCWMSDPTVRSNLGDAIEGDRDRWYVQGHIGSTWSGGQYVRTRDVEKCKVAFDDLLERFHTDHMDLGMMHYIDSPAEFEQAMGGAYGDYVRDLRRQGTIRNVGMSTHNPITGKMAIESGDVDMLLFSVNPAYDMKPASEDIETLFGDYGDEANAMDPDRMELYRLAEANDVGITVMKCFAGSRLLDPDRSPFGVALTPAQCIHYALTRPAVASVLLGYRSLADLEEDAAYETATPEERDYATALATAPEHPVSGLCTYCGHCAPCTVGIDIAQVNKFYDLAEVQVSKGHELPELVRDHYRALGVTADACIGCGACEPRCPFGVHIMERMVQASRLFG